MKGKQMPKNKKLLTDKVKLALFAYLMSLILFIMVLVIIKSEVSNLRTMTSNQISSIWEAIRENEGRIDLLSGIEEQRSKF